jgi:integrase
MARRIFGSVEKRGKRYRARYQSEGRWVSAPVTFATKADANAWLAGQQADTGRGVWVDPSFGKELFSHYARQWLETRSDLEDTTRAKYQGLLRLHVLPAFGSHRIAHIDPAAVRGWYHALAAKYKSTGDDAYRLLRAIMNTAVDDKRIGRSPCTVKGAGGTESAKRPIATIAELQGAVDALLPRYRAGFALAAWCQLRRGEVLGLQRQHVDMQALTIRVEQEWVVPPGKRPILKAPKTAAGYRVIDIPPNIAEVVQGHLDTFVGPGPTAWLFATANGTPVQPRNFFREWEKARKQVGRPELTIHDLRHSGLTWSAATGAPLAELMRRGGHKDSRAAVRYQQATRDSGKVLADALAALASHEVPSNKRVEALPTESNGTAALQTSDSAVRSAR